MDESRFVPGAPTESVLAWLLEGDPAIRWQVLRDLTDAPQEEVAAERARVASEGWGARLLALQRPDGTWGSAAWNRGWDSTMHVLWLLRHFGLDPDSAEARRAVDAVRDQVTWRGAGPPECDDHGFFEGELEPCINGQVLTAGAHFGQDVDTLVDRLLEEQLPDGGWNCEAPRGSTRSSFNTTICVLEGLLAYERADGARPDVTAARRRGEAYLLDRRLFRRKSTGEAIAEDRKGGTDWMRFAFPTWWHYDVLRGLEYLRDAAVAPDERVTEAVRLVASKRDADGRWPLDVQYPGTMPVDFGEAVDRPSRWNTLRALRVLDWYREGVDDGPSGEAESG
ncbi:MAG: hypothetical protein R6W77_15500 [Trueperaceae bacterium]